MTNENKEIAVRDKEQLSKSEGEPTRAGTYFQPAVDIFESKDAFIVYADLPGAKQDNLDIDVRDGVLSLTAAVDEPAQNLRPLYREYGVGGYMRRFTLSNKIDSARIEAALKDGVLTLTLPKADAARARKIEVQAE
jgi:HSP20 family protein